MGLPLRSRIAQAVAGAFGARLRPLPQEKRIAVPLSVLAVRTDLWVALLWSAMRASGRGFRLPCMKRRPPAGASRWRGERRPDKVAAAERNAKTPCFYGKLNYRRTGDLYL